LDGRRKGLMMMEWVTMERPFAVRLTGRSCSCSWMGPAWNVFRVQGKTASGMRGVDVCPTLRGSRAVSKRRWSIVDDNGDERASMRKASLFLGDELDGRLSGSRACSPSNSTSEQNWDGPQFNYTPPEAAWRVSEGPGLRHQALSWPAQTRT